MIKNLRTLAARKGNSGRVGAVVWSFKAAQGIWLVWVAAITQGELLEKKQVELLYSYTITIY